MEYAQCYLKVIGPRIVVPLLRRDDCHLTLRQQPAMGKLITGDDRVRSPLDPPPVVQITVQNTADACDNFLLNPNLFMTTILVGVHGTTAPPAVSDALVGNLASSLHRLKDENDVEGGFFIFGDLSVKVEGIFKLQFNLYEKRDDECFYVTSVDSIPFYVVEGPRYMSPIESTALTVKFCSQGMRLKLRKAPKTLVRRGRPPSADYQPRPHKSRKLSKSQGGFHGQSMQREDSRAEESVSAPVQPVELRPGMSYTPGPPHTPKQETTSQQPGTISDSHLEAMMMQQQRITPHPPHVTQSYAQPHQGLLYGDDQPHNLPYDQGVFSLSTMGPSISGQMLDHSFSQQAGPTQPGDTGGPLNYYQQFPYISQHSLPGIAASSSPEIKPLFPSIENVQEMPQGILQFGRPLSTPGSSLHEEVVEKMGNIGQGPNLSGFHLVPSAGQNLSAGSMGRGLSGPPSNDMSRTTSAPGEAS